jgi:lactoylglutathione lyase
MVALGISTIAKTEHMRLLYTMLRVQDLERSIEFYTQQLGMKLMRRQDYPEGRFTLAFVGYGDESTEAAIELTYNWDPRTYIHGDAFGHIAVGVNDAHETCKRLMEAGVKITRPPGPMKADPHEVIAFIEDPDGHRIELVQHRN